MNGLKYGLAGLFVAGFLCVSGQEDGGAAQFPELTPDTRGVGMGNTGIATPANAFSIWRNASRIVFSGKKAAAGYSFTPWMHERLSGKDRLHTAAGYYNLDEKQGVVAGFRLLRHAKVNDFTPKDWSVDAGYVRRLTENLSVDAVVRFVYSDMSESDKDAKAKAVAFDLGAYYRQAFADYGECSWAVGLQVSNFGSKIDYGYGKYDQPARVGAGGMLDWVFNEKHRLQGTLDAGCLVLPDVCWDGAVGAEYTAFGIVSVRGGYHCGERNDRTQRYGTVGCGVGFCHVRADFAWLFPETGSPLKNTWQVAVSVEL